MLLSVVTAKLLKSILAGIRPEVLNALATDCSELMTVGVIGVGTSVESLTASVMTLIGRPVALAQVAAQTGWWLAAQV
jgi:hypothetical protein